MGQAQGYSRATSLDWSNPLYSKTKEQQSVRWTRRELPDWLSTWIYRVCTEFLQIILCESLRKSLSEAIICVGRTWPIELSCRKKSLKCCHNIVYNLFQILLKVWLFKQNPQINMYVEDERLFEEGRVLGQKERKSSENQHISLFLLFNENVFQNSSD